MNVKSFAMLAVSGILAASCAYVAPAIADDATNPGQAMQAPPPADNGMSNPNGNTMPNNAPNTMPGSQGDMTNTAPSTSPDTSTNPPPSSSDMTTNPPPPSNPGAADENGTPDTATGDDDY